MQTRTIKNPFHTVVLHYHDKRKESSYEKALVKRYVAFVTMLSKKNDQVKALTESCYQEQFAEEEITNCVKELEAEIKSIGKALQKVNKKSFIDASDFSEIRRRISRATLTLDQLVKGKAEAMNKLVEKNNKLIDKLYDWFEDEDTKAFQMFHRYYRALYKVDAMYALDLVRFTDEIDEMKRDWTKVSKAWAAVYKLREETVDSSDEAAGRLSKLHELADTLQNDWHTLQEKWEASNN